MPFTASHAAAILPFLRTPLVPSALVAGSMAPDLVYYVPVADLLPFPAHAGVTHSLVGVLTVDVLLGLTAFVAWHGLLRDPAVDAAPRRVRAALGSSPALRPRAGVRSGRRALLVLVSLLVGAATHVLWDEFTHPRRFGTEHVAWLAQRQGPLPGYRWAQYGSTVAGAVVLAVWVLLWWRRQAAGRADGRPVGADLSRGEDPPDPPTSGRARLGGWLAIGGVGAVVGVLAASGPLTGGPNGGSYSRAAFEGSTAGAAASGVVAVALAAAWHARRWRRRRR